MKEDLEDWQVLCQQAAVEQDPVKLLGLVERINQMLEAKNRRLQEKRRETLSQSQSGNGQ